MAGSTNENGNLMDEFEEAFQMCLLSLTKQEPNTGPNKEEIELEVQKTTNRFIDVARQMEAFFLQKRFLVSTLKPDMLIKDENQDLRIEIQRKETLLNKHYNRLEEWKACLSDMQQTQGAYPRTAGAGLSSGMPPMSTDLQAMGGAMNRPGPGMVGVGGNMSPSPGMSGVTSAGMVQPGPQHQMQLQQMRMMNKFPK